MLIASCQKYRHKNQGDMLGISLPKFSKIEKNIIHKYYYLAVQSIPNPEEYFLYDIMIEDEGFVMQFYPLSILPLETDKKKGTFTFSTGSIWVIRFNKDAEIIDKKYIE